MVTRLGKEALIHDAAKLLLAARQERKAETPPTAALNVSGITGAIGSGVQEIQTFLAAHPDLVPEVLALVKTLGSLAV